MKRFTAALLTCLMLVGLMPTAMAAQVTDANSAFFDTRNNFAGCIAGVHEVLRRQGLFAGIWCLNPEETLSAGQSEEIDRVYAMYPDLNDDAFVKEFLAGEEA
jgi:opacity protein-like surface antigen